MNALVIMGAMALLMCGGTRVDAADAQSAWEHPVQSIMRQHHPRDAIPELVNLIENQRFLTELASDAVINLVRCFQSLHADPDIEDDYRRIVGRYLRQPPALDGHSLPDPAAVVEDLLWKAWHPDHEERFVLHCSGGYRWLDLIVASGETESVGGLTLLVLDVDAPEPQSGSRRRRETAPSSLRLDWSGHMDRRTLKIPARIDIAGEESERMLKVQIERGGSEALAGIWLDLDGLPFHAQRIDRLSATLPLSQKVSDLRHRVPLETGMPWSVSGMGGTLRSVATDGSGTKVTLTVMSGDQELIGSWPERPQENTARVEATSVFDGIQRMITQRTIIPEGENWTERQPWSEAFQLLDRVHGPVLPTEIRAHVGVNQTLVTLTFPDAGEPEMLLLLEEGRSSSRELPLVLEAIDLP